MACSSARLIEEGWALLGGDGASPCAIQRVFGSDAAPLAALRGAGLALVDRIAPLKRMFARHAAGR